MISDIDITIRLLLAAVLGSIIGFERERLLWAAGIRTHMLVSVGACLLMIVSAYGFQHALLMPRVVLDPSRIAAQVVSGIGFLGAGAILMRGQIVRGLTTAASIWAVAAIGLAAGGGLFFAATISTAIIIAILAGVKPLEEAYRARVQTCRLEVSADRDVLEEQGVAKAIGVRANQVKRMIIRDAEGGDTQQIVIQLSRVSSNDIRLATLRLRREPGVHDVKVTAKRRRADVQTE
ncbi:MgtC/SapB family protein [Caulobacter sp. S45]|uniref:MgtC/SapB family protein n=1 Tax=Caulobacter sp. S45 TaxID=1641861 RepID=UPI00131E3DD7|nr:MgtC/SapB family protein [Caulobacter sp. S45]